MFAENSSKRRSFFGANTGIIYGNVIRRVLIRLMVMPPKDNTENSNQETNEENLEKKKWMINVIDSAIQAIHTEIESLKQQWVIRFKESYPQALVAGRNRVLAGVAFIVTLLFSLNDFFNIESLKNIFLTVTIILLAYALIVFVFNIRKTQDVTKTINMIELGYSLPQTRLFTLKGSLSALALYPEKLTVKDLDELSDFVFFVGMNRIELVEAFKRASKDSIFKKDKEVLENAILEVENQMRLLCEQFKDKFTKEHPLGGNLYFLYGNMVEQYGPKQGSTKGKTPSQRRPKI